MEMHHKIAYVDYVCGAFAPNSTPDHYFTMRIRHNAMIKLHIVFYKENLYLKVHYDEKYSEVWANANSTLRIRINQIVVPDFADLAKLKNKIKTLLVFG